MRLLVSACLLGAGCRYDGKSNALPQLDRLLDRHTCVPVCPEQLGGLPTPRIPAERRGNRVIDREGKDVTAAFRRGAEEAVRMARLCGCRAALLKERSPSCGCGQIYDGTFTGTLKAGDGLAAQALKKAGLTIYGESRAEELLQDQNR